MPAEHSQSSKVAWVAGASRGVGRGIAIGLGEAGWTVWISSRSSDYDDSRTSHLPGAVESTASAVNAAGGIGIARKCDHTAPDQVCALAKEIGSMGPLDLLVNNAWAGYERLNSGEWAEWNQSFWEQPLELFDLMFDGGVRCHYVTSREAAPLLIGSKGLIVTVSMHVGREHKSGFGAVYSAAKAADDRLTLAMAAELSGLGVAAVSVYPGLVRTEGVMQFANDLDLSQSQSPEGVGRVIAALAADDDRAFSGKALDIGQLATHYGVDIGLP